MEERQKVAEDIQKELECPVCLDIYDNPKVLQCFHVACQQCLESQMQEGEEELCWQRQATVYD